MTDQLEFLTNKLLDEQLDDVERRQLNELLANEVCRRRFVELNAIHFNLSQRALPVTVRRTAFKTSQVHDRLLSLMANSETDYTCSLEVDPLGTGDHTLSSKGWSIVVRQPAVLGIAVVILLTCTLTILQISQYPDTKEVAKETKPAMQAASSSQAEKSVAERATGIPLDFAARVISMSEDAAWADDARPGDFLMRLPVGELLHLEHGMAKLEFASAAFVLLRAPVKLQILGPGHVLLKQGRLTGKSEESDFIVQTPNAYVVDVGTAFGVSVDEYSATDVVVFEGEVHVRRTAASKEKVRLTTGMAVRADRSGITDSQVDANAHMFEREFNGRRPTNLGMGEISLVDVICGSDPNEFRSAGSIDPETGMWSTLPWSESKGVRGKVGTGTVVPVKWNPWVHGIFVPNQQSQKLVFDLSGNTVDLPAITGGGWGPVWARRKMNRQLDPLASELDRDLEGFWGAGTTTALLDRSRWVRDGVVGLHANVGITIDLQAIRQSHGSAVKTFRGVLAHLEQSHVSQPFQPEAKATFQVFVDGKLRYNRTDFCRQDGDTMFGVELNEGDQLMSLIATDGADGPVYDRVILLDPILELIDH